MLRFLISIDKPGICGQIALPEGRKAEWLHFLVRFIRAHAGTDQNLQG